MGGWVAAGLPHRTWIDPFLPGGWLPAEPRLVFFGDARTMARSPARRWVVRRVGGILPIPSHGGPRSFATHLAAAGEVLARRRGVLPVPGVRDAVHRWARRARSRRASATSPCAPGRPSCRSSSAATTCCSSGGGSRSGSGSPLTWRRAGGGRRSGAGAGARRPRPGSAEERRLARRVSEGLHVRHGAGRAAGPRGRRATSGRPAARDAPDAPLPLSGRGPRRFPVVHRAATRPGVIRRPGPRSSAQIPSIWALSSCASPRGMTPGCVMGGG